MDTIELYLSKLSYAKELYSGIAEKTGNDDITDSESLFLALSLSETPISFRLFISDEDISNESVDEIIRTFEKASKKNKLISFETITDEFLNLLDKSEKLTQTSKPRTLVHRDGDLHVTVHVWIIKRKDMGVYVLLQKRAASKLINPGCYDVSAAGHVAQGEEIRTTAVKELYEELGLKLSPDKLIHIGNHKNHYQHGDVNDNEFSAVYIYNGKVDADELTLSPDEVEEVCWAEIDEMLSVIKNDEFLNCISLEELDMIKKAVL